MENTKILATTHYGDYKGNVAVDKADLKNPLRDFAKDNGIDIKKYFLLSAIYNYQKHVSYVEIIATTVASDYDSIREYILNHEKPLPVKRFTIDISLENYLKYMKRFSFMLPSHSDFIGQEINILEDVL